MEQPNPELLTYDDFRAFVADKDGRYEFVDGHAIALASPKKPHARLATKLGARFEAHLTGQRCDVHFGSDVQTAGKNARQPDVCVTCDKYDFDNDDDVLRAPKLLVEMLSPATESADLREKLAEYQAMPSVEEYVVMDSRRRWVRRYYRGNSGLFVFDRDMIGGCVRLASIGYTLNIDTLYAEARIH